ncbi:hypothetical protein FHW72_003464 [Ochrobactrum sp. RC6B]|nr:MULTISPECIES: hypothetical protein [Brucella/Ochrobactrum group]MBB3218359.1 hypothetical protein [Ochrobactrum sp. RC6B]
MTKALENLKLKLSPNVRLRMTFEREMTLDKEEKVFNNSLYQKYLSMYERAASRQDTLLRSLVIADGILAIFIFGKDISIPHTELSIREFPAALEILTFFASFSFMMLCLSFANTQAYLAICNQFTNRIAMKYNIDPDFISASDIFTEFHIKLFRPKMNIFGIDFFEAGYGYRWFYSSLLFLLSIIVISIIALHMSIIGYAIYLISSTNIISIVLICVVFIINICGLLVNIAPSFNFTIAGSTS